MRWIVQTHDGRRFVFGTIAGYRTWWTLHRVAHSVVKVHGTEVHGTRDNGTLS